MPRRVYVFISGEGMKDGIGKSLTALGRLTPNIIPYITTLIHRRKKPLATERKLVSIKAQ